MTRVLLRGISRLPDKYRQPLIMCYFEGVSYSKIADRMNVPLGSVKTLIRTGKEKLKTVIGDLDQGLMGHGISLWCVAYG